MFDGKKKHILSLGILLYVVAITLVVIGYLCFGLWKYVKLGGVQYIDGVKAVSVSVVNFAVYFLADNLWQRIALVVSALILGVFWLLWKLST